MADITVTSRDLERVRRLHKRFPGLIEKTFPATAREETKEFRRSIRNRVIGSGWPRSMQWSKGGKPMDLSAVKTAKYKSFREMGISIKPRHMGPTVLFELGSKGVRFRKRGGNTGIMPAKPAYGPAWDTFKASGKNDIQRSFVKATIRVINRELRKRGLK